MDRFLKQAFRRFKHDLVQLVLKEDAFGLALNKFCPTGAGGGVDPTCGAGAGRGGLPRPVDVPVPPTLVQKVLAKVGAAAKAIRGKARAIYKRLEARYGAKGAGAIFLSGQAISWGAFLAGAAAGQVVYVPSAVAMAPGAAIAEIARAARGRGKQTHNVEELTQEEVDRLARELIAELNDFWKAFVLTVPDGPVENVRWAMVEPHDQAAEFQRWTKLRFAQLLSGRDQRDAWSRYILQAFSKGAGRTVTDVRGTAVDPLVRNELIGAATKRTKAKLLAQQSFSDLEGVADATSAKLAKLLSQGLLDGDSPRAIAKVLAAETDFSLARALTLARTEITRAHAQGQLALMKDMGVAETGVEVEWRATDDDRVCEQCSSMDGATFSVEEADGLIPAHPNCRCAFIPAV